MQNDKDLPEKADEYGRTVSPYFNIEDKQEKYRADKLFKRLRRKVGHAIGDYGMIEEGIKSLYACLEARTVISFWICFYH